MKFFTCLVEDHDLMLVGLAALICVIGSLVIALPAGLLAALKRRHWQGFLVNALAQVGMAIPVFWGGILLVLLFAVKLRWLPANGYVQKDGNGYRLVPAPWSPVI